jgi:uncharacterized membrane protein YfhO
MVAPIHDDTEISRFQRTGNGLSFDVKTNRNEMLELPLVYYVGYHAELNGQKQQIRESRNGLVEVHAGSSGSMNVYYAGTFIQKISVWLTLLGLLFIVLPPRVFSRITVFCSRRR